MRLRHLAAGLLGSTLAACGSDPTSPPLPTTKVVMNICPVAVSWVGFRNENAEWKKVNMTVDGEVSFDATEKVSFAFVQSASGIALTQVLNITSAELLAANDLPCESVYGFRAVNGAVADVTGEQVARIRAASSSASATAANTSWALTDLPNSGGIDIVALRYPTSSTSTPDRVIVRRGLVPTTIGMQVPALDFASTESQPLESAIVTYANGGTDLVGMETMVWTGNNTRSVLESKSTTSGPHAFSYVSLPAGLRTSIDLQRLHGYASASGGTRVIYEYFKTPANKTYTFGPPLSSVTITQLGTTPYLRLRASFASQTDYPSAARALFYQNTGATGIRQFAVTTTAAHAGGTPSSWTLDVPDFGAVAFQNNWGLAPGAYSWYAYAYNGNLIYEGRPADGTKVSTALRFGGATSTMQANAFPQLYLSP